MRIAYITNQYPKATDTFIQREVLALRDIGLEVDTFSIRQANDEHIVGVEQQLERNRTFYILPLSPFGLLRAHAELLARYPQTYCKAVSVAWCTRQPGLKGIVNQFAYFAEAGILAKELLSREICHIHNHSPDISGTVTLLAAEMGDFTFSITLHGPYVFKDPKRWHLQAKMNQALFISCISHFSRSQGMLFSSVETWNKMYVVHCGVKPSSYEKTNHKMVGTNLLYVGRLATTKGMPILLKSLIILRKKIPDIFLTIIGDGPDKALIQNMVISLNIQNVVRFTGYQSQTTVREYMQNSDVLVLPSFAEGVPVVLMEAMASGIPVVATQIAGVSELVKHGESGYLVPPGDVMSLAIAVEKLMLDPSLRNSFGSVGSSIVRKDFNIDVEAKRLYEILLNSLKE